MKADAAAGLCIRAFGPSSLHLVRAPMALTVHGHPQTFPRYSPYSYPCDRCSRFEIECAWPRGPDVCLDCACHCRALQACLKHVPLLRTRLRIEPNLEMMAWVDAFCVDYKPYIRKAKQLYFLNNVLRVHGSPFRGKQFGNRRRLGQNHVLPMSSARRMS